MNAEPLLSKKVFLSIIFFTLVFTGYIFITAHLQKEMNLRVCNVGNAVMTHLRLKNGIDILFYPRKHVNTVLCLSKAIPFYDKRIEFAFIDKEYVVEKEYKELEQYYNIDTMIINAKYKSLLSTMRIKSKSLITIHTNSKIGLGDNNLNINVRDGNEITEIVSNQKEHVPVIIIGSINNVPIIKNYESYSTIIYSKYSFEGGNILRRGFNKPKKLIINTKKNVSKLLPTWNILNISKLVMQNIPLE